MPDWKAAKERLGLNKNMSFDRVINHVIRQKLVGGETALEALSEVHKLTDKLQQAELTEQASEAENARQALLRLKKLMGADAFDWVTRNS